jgi:7,8-dihydropterin-6-yl-methyl-4-(beta-D-ribofuranosyl)aminobenzene 5'-phosphate synthase
MKSKRSLSVLLILLFLVSRLAGQDYKYLESKDVSASISSSAGIDNPVLVKVIYDNYVSVEGMKADWGYSVYIEGLEKEILFDTGTKPEIFEENFKKLGINAGKIDYLVLSHEHFDHVGGIPAFIRMRKNIPVIIPHSFSEKFKRQMSESGLEPLLVNKPAMICNNLWTSGEFEYEIPEQALVLNTKQGLVVMTGCSHPGILEMLKKVKSDFNKNIYMVFGGFHLMQKSDKDMNEIISEMKALGVVKCGATHCTGDKQIKMIRAAFGEDYFELGVGNTVIIN